MIVLVWIGFAAVFIGLACLSLISLSPVRIPDAVFRHGFRASVSLMAIGFSLLVVGS